MNILDQSTRPFPFIRPGKAHALTGRSGCFFLHRVVLAIIFLCVCPVAQGHDIITTRITWNREISRIVYARCGTCHSQGGTSFPLMNYQEARPWAAVIEKEVLGRQMPPWGAVKGYGEFRNDQALTQEQLELIANWVDGGAPEGDPNDLLPPPPAPLLKFPKAPDFAHHAGEIIVTSDFKIDRPIKLDGLLPASMPDTASAQIFAELPNGSFVPLVWLFDYKKQFVHPFLLRTPLALPSGTIIHGTPSGSSLVLLPAIPARGPEHQSASNAGTPPR